ncbi:MAG: polysaccharide biosynthesis/export family protein [Flavobacteriaceae bacterium]|nr:polysaccharide biosynthesis/export family protein [Flavobacteriaceae bacterium]
MKKFFLIVILGTYLTSCIPTKDLIYFQGEPKKNTKISTVLNKAYRLQVNDIVNIRIKANDEKLVALFKSVENENTNLITSENLYFSSYTIDHNGVIRIPYLNEINILGYTEKEVRLKIESELSKMFKSMNTIFVAVKLAGIRYTVLGEVKNPGTNVLFQNQVTIVEAIANAGDITITGDRKKVTVVRNNADGVKKFQLNMTSFDFINQEGYFIEPNDIIYIEPLKQKSWGTGDTGAKTFTTVVTALTLITTTILLIRNL